MKKRYLNPKELFDPRFFTHTVAVEGEFTLVYVAGQVSYDRDGVVVGKGDMRAQAEQVFKSLTHNLKAAGAAWSDVVKLNGYMVRMSPEAVNQYREVRSRFLDPKALPASTLIGVERLVHDDLLLEVEVVAAVAARPAAKSAAKR
ncbi:MAG TPA: RidA family protein [Burkholderiales bacterium]|nr:RidA family protein [Burkholderiales bacterium]